MAQKEEGSRRKKVTTRQQKEEDRRKEIEKLTNEIEILRIALDQLNGELDGLELPQLEGKAVHHTQYGDGTVTQQKDAVITVEYESGTKKQKLPFVIASGCVAVDDAGVQEDCQKILDLEKERNKLKLEIQHKESWIMDLENQIAKLKKA
jgi:predicted  nucleic acid-binding Zn-ribbon protein